MNQLPWPRAHALIGVGLVAILMAGGCAATSQTVEQSNTSTSNQPDADIRLIAPRTSDGMPALDVGFHPHLPAIPYQAMLLHHSGMVMLDVKVDAKGKVLDVVVEKSSGYQELDDSAVEAVRGWRFSPGFHDGKPVDGVVRLPVNFPPN